MMNFSVNRETLLKPLQQLAGVVEKRQTLPVLSNVLLVIQGNQLTITGTDLELEYSATIELLSSDDDIEITLPAAKLLDICKSLQPDHDIRFKQEAEKVLIRSGKSRFTLSTLPATDFPCVPEVQTSQKIEIPQLVLKRLIDQTSFSMARQDVRYYLNGMMLEFDRNLLRAVTTDGHRLAMATADIELDISDAQQVIVPRKGVAELSKLLGAADESSKMVLSISTNHLRISTDSFTFTSKLIDGKFPDYNKVVPRGGDKIVETDREAFRSALTRAAILSNEKYRGIRLDFKQNLMTLVANNPEQEEAEELLDIDYQGADLEIGFNLNYIQDVLSVIANDKVKLILSDGNSSILMEDPKVDNATYVVMPMRL